MSRLRQVSPWYWVLLVILVASGGLFVANHVLGWGLIWAPIGMFLVTLVTNIFTFRQLWKQSDHPAFHNRDGKDSIRTHGGE
jgi:hypothetical protein